MRLKPKFTSVGLMPQKRTQRRNVPKNLEPLRIFHVLQRKRCAPWLTEWVAWGVAFSGNNLS